MRDDQGRSDPQKDSTLFHTQFAGDGFAQSKLHLSDLDRGMSPETQKTLAAFLMAQSLRTENMLRVLQWRIFAFVFYVMTLVTVSSGWLWCIFGVASAAFYWHSCVLDRTFKK